MTTLKKFSFSFLLFVLSVSFINAQDIRLVKDINNHQASQIYLGMIDVNGTAFFFKKIGTNSFNVGLWKSDGTANGTVLLKEFTNISATINLINLNGKLLFSIENNYPNLNALWQSDGTVEGTVKIKDIAVGGKFVLCDNKVFFSGSDYTNKGFELWKTDGTSGGTVIVKEIYSGSQGGMSNDMAAINNTLFFRADDGIAGSELWKSDGTEAGTLMVKDINPGSTGGLGSANSLFNYNGTLVFAANDGVTGWELWKSDGTAIGTSLIKDINPGPNSSFTSYYGMNYAISTNGLTFTTYLNSKRELWRTDGTVEGTLLLLSNLYNYKDNSSIALNGFVFFAHNSSLWKTDGTVAGTAIFHNADFLSNTVSFNNKIFFITDYYPYAEELWESDGTTEGTKIVKDIAIGNDISSTPKNLIISDNKLFFLADDNISGYELWKSDGTAAGTALVKELDIMPTGDSNPYGITEIGNKFFFTAKDAYNEAVWVSDGSTSNTKKIYVYNGYTNDIVKFRNHIYFEDGYNTMLRTNLALDSTSISPFYFFSSSGSYLVVDTTLYFSNRTCDGFNCKYSFHKTNGITSTLIKDFSTVGGSSLSNLIKVGNLLFFTLSTSGTGRELWRSDGTDNGTYLVKDILPGQNNYQFMAFNQINGILIFALYKSSSSSYELWRSDGSESGTFKLQEFKALYGLQHQGQLNNTLLFGVSNLQSQSQLWKTDGSIANTVAIKTMVNIPEKFKPFMNQSVFLAYDELWKTDGTTDGTIKLTSNNNLHIMTDLFVLNKYTLIFGANDYYKGVELWKTDGRTFTTSIFKDIIPEGGSSEPENFVRIKNKLYFAAKGPGNYGKELWVMDLPNCEDEINIVTNTNTGNTQYKAVFNVNASAIISGASTKITYEAGNSVSLTPGFQAQAGTVFKAQIADCPTN